MSIAKSGFQVMGRSSKALGNADNSGERCGLDERNGDLEQMVIALRSPLFQK